MRWLLDECVDAALVGMLRDLGHDVIYTGDIAPRARDADVMNLAARERRLLLTEDKDFGDLIFRQGRAVPGLVLLRINPAHRQLKEVRLAAAIERFGTRLLGRYTVIEEGRFRGRSLQPIKSA